MIVRHGVRPGVVLLGAGLLGAGLLGACGSPEASSPSSGSAVHSTCQEVQAVLSDGPTPQTDRVGYAEAQIIPLRQIHASDTALKKAIDDLANAYQTFYDAGGAGSAVAKGVDSAGHEVDKFCPGAVT